MKHIVFPIKFLGIPIIFSCSLMLFDASTWAEPLQVLEPKTYEVKKHVGANINDKYFMIKGSIDYFFSSLPGTIKVPAGTLEVRPARRIRTALSQRIQTKNFYLHRGPPRNLSEIIFLVLGCLFIVIILFHFWMEDDIINFGRNLKILFLLTGISFLLMIFFAKDSRGVYFDNASNREYVVYIDDGRRFVLPPQTHCRIYMDCDDRVIFHVRVVDRESYQTVDQEAIQVNSGGRNIFNINSRNSYLLERGSYQ